MDDYLDWEDERDWIDCEEIEEDVDCPFFGIDWEGKRLINKYNTFVLFSCVYDMSFIYLWYDFQEINGKAHRIWVNKRSN